jgi:8-oxo-dGTP pyrophosphatase MutT (NUDIX family)
MRALLVQGGALADTLLKLAEKPLRERVEVYALKDGKVLAGIYPDGSVGVPGGGVSSGESPEHAAKREYKEEAGLTVKNLQPLPVPPLVEKWEKRKDLTDKEKERRKEFSGSRTHFYIADLSGKGGKAVDPSALKRLVPRSVAALVDKLQEQADSGKKRDKVRLKVLETVQELTS